MFWALDAYYLRQEKLYRKLYESARSADQVDFSMDASVFDDQVMSTRRVAWSLTLRQFHGTLCGSVIVVVMALVIL